MSVEVFIDTNILVYTFDATAPVKRDCARHLVHEAVDKGNAAINWQVGQEFLNVALNKFENPLILSEASETARTLLQTHRQS